MNTNERRKYIRRMRMRYVKAGRKERGQLLDEMEAITEMHRKSLIRLINGDLERKPRSKERGKTYGVEVDGALRIIDESLDYICAERLTPALVKTAKQLAAYGELETTLKLLEQLEEISVSTVKRRLVKVRRDQYRSRRRKGAKRSNSLARDIPMRRIPWNEREPGHLEIDLMLHCGDSAAGEFMCTLQMIDVATTWSERVGILGRSYLVAEDAYRRILRRLPFPIVEIHPDNGSEFINHQSVRFWGEIVQGVSISRSQSSVSPEHQELLERLRDQINPRQLRQEIYDLIDQIFALPGAVAGVSEDVFETLIFHLLSQMPEHEKQNVLDFSFNRTSIKEQEEN